MSEPYFVEVDRNGCSHCGGGRLWHVIGPDGTAGAKSYGDADDAEDEAEILNIAYDAGRSSLVGAARKLANEAQGFLAMADREIHGNTNIQVLALRIKEMLEALDEHHSLDVTPQDRA